MNAVGRANRSVQEIKDRISGFLQEILLTPVQTCIYCLVRRGQFLAVGTLFRVFAGQLEGTVSPPFCLF